MISPAWFYDELKQVGVDFEDTAQVAAFDRNQTSSTIAAENALVNRLGIAAGNTVIDIGCGTGTFAIQAALAGATVYAVDISQAMLTYAQQKAQTSNVPNIEFHEVRGSPVVTRRGLSDHAGFLTYEHQGAPADFIVTKAALHHLPDFWKMVALLRMATMLRDRGILYLRDVVFSFDPVEYQLRIEAWIERVAKPPGEGFIRQDFETHIREEHTTFAWILEGMLQQAGFEIEHADRSATGAQYICRKANASQMLP